MGTTGLLVTCGPRFRLVPRPFSFFFFFFVSCYWMLPGFTGFFFEWARVGSGNGFCWLLLGFYRVFFGCTGCDWLSIRLRGFLLGFTGFYRVFFGCNGCEWLSKRLRGFLLGFNGFYWVFIGCTVFFGVFLGFTEVYQVSLNLSGFEWGWRGSYWVYSSDLMFEWILTGFLFLDYRKLEWVGYRQLGSSIFGSMRPGPSIGQ